MQRAKYQTPKDNETAHSNKEAWPSLACETHGSWTELELMSLPRFPHQDSFPTAKLLIGRYLEGCLSYHNLRIGLFWLGFGLLNPPTPEEPTIGLVPLCKDLGMHEDWALELGYDAKCPVNSQPILRGGMDNLPLNCTGSSASWCKGNRDDCCSADSASASASACSTGSASAGSASSSASSSVRPGGACTMACPSSGSMGSTIMEEPMLGSADGPTTYKSRGSSEVYGDDPYAAFSRNKGKPFSRSAAAYNPRSDVEQLEYGPGTVYKVKLIFAGGWSSSDSSSSDDSANTPTAAGASSSASAGTGEHGSGGLNAECMGHFTVSYVSDVGTQEDPGGASTLCAFCLDEMQIGHELCRLPCMHTFHRHCVHAWLERDRRCMLCRFDVTKQRPCGRSS